MATFNYTISVTGDCQNNGSGIISILPSGGTPPYTIEWIEPNLSADITETTPSVRAGLYSGTYALRLNDSTLPINNEFFVNIPISNGVCCSVLNVDNTTCAQNNGAVTGTSNSFYSSTNFTLYTSNNQPLQTQTTNQQNVIFTQLSAGTYYLVATDLGGCTGKSQTFVVENSDVFDYGFYLVPNSSCGGSPIGKIIVTGQTGTAPYVYNWSNGLTGSTITGLTEGIYSVNVIDSLGCSLTKTASLGKVDPVGISIITQVQPTCLQNNGQITVNITGGTAPYYYLASTGNFEISYSQQYTLTGLSAGLYSFTITDAGFCQTSGSLSIQPPQGISNVTITTQNSVCSSSDGSISITVIGGTANFTYLLIRPDGSTDAVTIPQQNYTFSNLSTGTYGVSVSDSTGCSLLETKTIIAEDKFTATLQTTGTTCNRDNGAISVVLSSGGTSPYDYSIDNVTALIDTTLTAVTFTNISAGVHTIKITDFDGCVKTVQTFVPGSPQLNFSLYPTSCGSGKEGVITAFITSGTPPFTFNWSGNVPGNPQQITVNQLTAGTYSLTVIDSTGCSLQRETTINCFAGFVSYQTYIMGSDILTVNSPSKYGLLEMLNEGYFDLTEDEVGCNLVSAVFNARVSIQPAGTIVNQPFFTTTDLTIVPSDNDWYDTLKSILLTISGVQDVIIDDINNQITIVKSPNNTSLNNQQIIIELVIDYDILCL